MTIYGIPNCDTIKKTLNWFKENKIDFEFHDYKKSPITKSKLEAWSKKVGWDILLNKKGTTWRKLPVDQQGKITTQTAAIKLMMENNSIIKRPVVEDGEKLLVGFNETDFIKQLK
jgi:arsenate reductase (glutaredoxin)